MKLNCYLFLCVFACKYFYVTHMSLVPRGQKKAFRCPGNEVTDVVKHVDAQNETWVLRKRSK